jgi:hypothetical protein
MRGAYPDLILCSVRSCSRYHLDGHERGTLLCNVHQVVPSARSRIGAAEVGAKNRSRQVAENEFGIPWPHPTLGLDVMYDVWMKPHTSRPGC